MIAADNVSAIIPVLGAAVAVVITAVGGVLKLTFNALARKDEQFLTSIAATEARHEKFLTNHMSTMTKTQESAATAMQAMAIGMNDVVHGMDLLHEDNVNTADLLRKADIMVVRKVDEVARTLAEKDEPEPTT